MSDSVQLSLFDVQSESAAPQLTIEDLIPEMKNLLRIFDVMEIAEDEIERAMHQYPNYRYLIYGAFMTIRPQFEMPEKLYRQHCREIFKRIASSNPDLNRATSAEVLGALMRVSWILPMHNEPSALYMKLFRQLFPEDIFDGIDLLSERYPGETDNLRAELEGKLKFKRDIPVERVPYWELLEIEHAEGYESGWADAENVRQIQVSREARSA